MPFLLKTALTNFQKRFPQADLYEQLKDAKGVYAYKLFNKQTGKYAFLAAKGSMDGDVLSIHLSLFVTARAKNMPIFLSVGEDRFYRYMPADIVREKPYLNERDGVDYVNFSIKIGQSLQEKKQEEPKPQPVLLFEEHPVVNALKEQLGAEL